MFVRPAGEAQFHNDSPSSAFVAESTPHSALGERNLNDH